MPWARSGWSTLRGDRRSSPRSGWSTLRGGRRSSPRSGRSTLRGGRRSSPLWRPRGGCRSQAGHRTVCARCERKPQKHSPRAHASGWKWLEHTAGRPQELTTKWLEHTAGRPQELATKWLEHTAGRPQELATVAAARRLPEPGRAPRGLCTLRAQAAEAPTAGACLGLEVVGAHCGEAAGARHEVAGHCGDPQEIATVAGASSSQGYGSDETCWL